MQSGTGHKTCHTHGELMAFAITEKAISGLYFIHKYRFLTIKQYGKITSLSRNVASDNLRSMERLNWIGHIGNMPVAGQGKTPKTYYLKQKGYDAILEHSGRSEDDLGGFVRAHTGISWSPVMYHRLETVSVLIAMHLETHQTQDLRLIGTRLEYVRKRVGGKLQSETTDTFQGHQSATVRIVPDAAFAIANIKTGGRALFFLELDRGTEPITATTRRNSIMGKFQNYDTYLKSRKFRETYSRWGEFKNFSCLFVTPSDIRIQNVREASGKLDPRCHPFYRLCSYEKASDAFYHDRWQSRDPEDEATYGLVKSR